MNLKIGAVAKMTGLSPSGIRFLEEQGLLTPSGGRKGKYRAYTLEDVSSVLDYRNYRKCGLSQEEIFKIFHSEDATEIFEQHCDELERQILETTRLLHFLRHRNRDASQIRHIEGFWEIAERPALLWMPVLSDDGKTPRWPAENGFEFPYTDSALLFGQAILHDREPEESLQIGIGMLESDILNASFLDMNEVLYFRKHPAFHCIVEITGDFRVSADSLRRVRMQFNAALEEHGLEPVPDAPVISKRIMTYKQDGIRTRYDHLWIDVR